MKGREGKDGMSRRELRGRAAYPRNEMKHTNVLSMTQALPTPAQFAVYSKNGTPLSLSANDAARSLFPSLVLCGGTSFPEELPCDLLQDSVREALRKKKLLDLTTMMRVPGGDEQLLAVRIFPIDGTHALLLYHYGEEVPPRHDGNAESTAVTDQAQDGILYLDTGHRVRYVTPSFAAMTGYTEQDWSSGAVTLDSILHDEDRERFDGFMRRIAGCDGHETEEFRIRRADGSVRWMDIGGRGLRSPAGEHRGMLCRMQDISGRKQTEKRLQLMQFTLEHIDEAVFWLREDGSFFFVNNAASALLQYSQDELLEMSAGDVDPPRRHPYWQDFFEQVRCSKRTVIEAVLHTKTGNICEVEITAKYLYFEETGYICAFVREIGERKRQTRNLRVSRARLSDALQLGKMGYFDYYVDSDVIELPPETRQLLGVHPLFSSIRGKNYLASILTPQQLQEFSIAVKELVQRNDPSHEITLVHELIRGDGHRYWMNTRLHLREAVGMEAVITGVTQEVTDVRRTELAMRAVVHETATSGAEFFPSLVRGLSHALGVRYAFVAERSDTRPDRLLPHAFCKDGLPLSFDRFDVDGTPNGTVLREGMYHCPATARTRFPDSAQFAEFGIESYLGVALTGTSGEPIGVLAVMHDEALPESRLSRDIMQLFAGRAGAELERLRAQRGSEWLRSQFEQVFNYSIDGITIIHDEKVLLPNPAAVQMFRFTTFEDVVGQSMFDFIHPDDHDAIKMYMQQRMMGEEVPDSYEFTGVCRDGAYIDIEGHVSLYWLDGKPHFMVLMRDISARKAAARALEESELKFRQLAENVQDVFWMRERGRSGFVYISPGIERLTGHSRKAVDDDPALLHRIVHPADSSRIIEQRNRMWDGSMYREEFRIVDAKGAERWLREETFPVHDADNRLYRIAGICSDITDRKRFEIDLIEAKEKAELSDRLKDAFIATVSHEIRTPLNIIGGFANLLQMDCSGHCTEDTADYFDSIQRGIERLNRTVDLILNVSRLRSGDIQLAPSALDLPAFLEAIVEDMWRIAGEKGLSLVFDCEVETAILQLDEYTMAQALENLIDNAIKFTDQGEVRLWLHAGEDGAVRLDIIDTGIGIAEEYLPHIFDRYSQEDVGLTRRYEGLGLGLSLVKEYLALNHADIHVRSRKNEGSCFSITFQQ